MELFLTDKRLIVKKGREYIAYEIFLKKRGSYPYEISPYRSSFPIS
jgi:hypothetical protein